MDTKDSGNITLSVKIFFYFFIEIIFIIVEKSIYCSIIKNQSVMGIIIAFGVAFVLASLIGSVLNRIRSYRERVNNELN